MGESDKTLRRSAKKARCAIYTRKSSEEGLEQAFNSLTPSGKPAPPSFSRKSTKAGRCCRRSMMMAGFPAAQWSGQP
jgi:hypothetical protein